MLGTTQPPALKIFHHGWTSFSHNDIGSISASQALALSYEIAIITLQGLWTFCQLTGGFTIFF